MINKSLIVSAISKYYLNGLNNQVKWRIKDKILTVYGGGAGRVCKVELKNFPLEDGEIGVFDTNKLSKLISITSGTLMLSLEKVKSIFTKLYIQDNNYNLTYSLADVLILGKNTYYKDPENWSIQITLEENDIDNLIKAKNALSEVNHMVISTSRDLDHNNICEFIFGDNTGFSNKISYQVQEGEGKISEEGLTLPFDSNIFRDILNANKDQLTCSLKISPEGIMKLNFESEDIKSEYFLARNE
jgi:hypothetical protein